LFLFPFFFPPAVASSTGDVLPLAAPPTLVQALTGVLYPLLSRRMPGPEYPGVKSVLVGFGAAGRAGKASAVLLGALLLSATEEVARDGIGETRELDVDVAHGVCPGFAPMRLDDVDAESGGNGLLDDAVAQLACRLTADLED
jgi:hypothetical protein